MIQDIAKENGVELNFFQGTWGAKEVAYFLGIAEKTVRNRKAGLENIPVVRLGNSNGAKRTVMMLRYLPQDIIAHREKLHQQAINRTPQAVLRMVTRKAG